MNVQLLDLKAQYQSLKSELDAALLKTAESQYFIMGPEVTKLEDEISEYLGAKHSVGVSSGTDALLLALMALDIKASDEVIVPTYSFFATAGVVSRLNAIPVFVDSDPVTFNIDPAQIEAKITDKTKAIIPVHLYGQSADMDAIMEIAKKHNLKVVEDGAQAISAQYKDGKCVGTIGDIGCYSFFPSKNLGCFGDGGMTVTMDADLAELLKVKRVHGGKPKYYHSMIGGNFRLDAIQAGVLSVKLPHLDSWSQARRDNAALYTKLFVEAGLAEEEGKISLDENNKVLLPKAVYKETGHKNYHIYNQYVIRVEKRDELIAHLRSANIGCEIYYPVPFHKQECFKDLPSSKDEYPNADYAAEHSIALPIYPELTKEQITYVVNTIKEFMG
ncbi:MAG: transcriptional regulator [Ignavibacteriales bacterium CG18_big_fil_WC_8_21_14_2_50_31_20]|nr:MAG: transcriptional regulator [Ignavibacteriales bacterium CG18_big_fil_WC_8_21_14_2_50_31_20]